LTIPAVDDGLAHGDLGLVEDVDDGQHLAFGDPGSSRGGVLEQRAGYVLRVCESKFEFSRRFA
jgi:hypothetical protein